jgi:hypothetical protein
MYENKNTIYTLKNIFFYFKIYLDILGLYYYVSLDKHPDDDIRLQYQVV